MGELTQYDFMKRRKTDNTDYVSESFGPSSFEIDPINVINSQNGRKEAMNSFLLDANSIQSPSVGVIPNNKDEIYNDTIRSISIGTENLVLQNHTKFRNNQRQFQVHKKIFIWSIFTISCLFLIGGMLGCISITIQGIILLLS